jgi:hypothetical protein
VPIPISEAETNTGPSIAKIRAMKDIPNLRIIASGADHNWQFKAFDMD